MSGGKRPIGAAKVKQSDTEALCQPPPPSGLCDSDANQPGGSNIPDDSGGGGLSVSNDTFEVIFSPKRLRKSFYPASRERGEPTSQPMKHSTAAKQEIQGGTRYWSDERWAYACVPGVMFAAPPPPPAFVQAPPRDT